MRGDSRETGPKKILGGVKGVSLGGLDPAHLRAPESSAARTNRQDPDTPNNGLQSTGKALNDVLAMAGHRKRKKMRAALLRRAEQTGGEVKTALDYVISWVASGGSIKGLAGSLQEEIGESLSRNFLSLIAHRLSADATQRISLARSRARTSRLGKLAVTEADNGP